ncbi:hypothetical protein ACWCV9_12125 [Streptomyces sp. NPDC001606]
MRALGDAEGGGADRAGEQDAERHRVQRVPGPVALGEDAFADLTGIQGALVRDEGVLDDVLAAGAGEADDLRE